MKKKELFSLLRDDSYQRKINGVAKALQLLTSMEEDGKTSYTGADLNVLESINEKICDETITNEDILRVEKLVFKFL
jgi:hypothetical protein